MNFGEEIDMFPDHNNNTDNNNMDDLPSGNFDNNMDNNNIDMGDNNNIDFEEFSDSEDDDLPSLFDLNLKKRGEGDRREGERGGAEEMEEGWEEVAGGDEFPMGTGEDKIHVVFSVEGEGGKGGEGEGEGGVGGFGIGEAPDLKMKVFGNTLMSLPPSFAPGAVWGLWKYEVFSSSFSFSSSIHLNTNFDFNFPFLFFCSWFEW